MHFYKFFFKKKLSLSFRLLKYQNKSLPKARLTRVWNWYGQVTKSAFSTENLWKQIVPSPSEKQILPLGAFHQQENFRIFLCTLVPPVEMNLIYHACWGKNSKHVPTNHHHKTRDNHIMHKNLLLVNDLMTLLRAVHRFLTSSRKSSCKYAIR